MQRVAVARQRDLAPQEARRAHIDAYAAARRRARLEEARRGLDHDALLAGLAHDERCDAARAIAAGGDLAAIGVADAHEDVGARRFRLLQDEQLVAADPGVPVGNGAYRLAVERQRLSARIEHDEIIAEPVHLEKTGAAHAALYKAPR